MFDKYICSPPESAQSPPTQSRRSLRKYACLHSRGGLYSRHRPRGPSRADTADVIQHRRRHSSAIFGKDAYPSRADTREGRIEGAPTLQAAASLEPLYLAPKDAVLGLFTCPEGRARPYSIQQAVGMPSIHHLPGDPTRGPWSPRLPRSRSRRLLGQALQQLLALAGGSSARCQQRGSSARSSARPARLAPQRAGGGSAIRCGAITGGG